jgi:hypothetical protein
VLSNECYEAQASTSTGCFLGFLAAFAAAFSAAIYWRSRSRFSSYFIS